jgi:hypothetical protein
VSRESTDIELAVKARGKAIFSTAEEMAARALAKTAQARLRRALPVFQACGSGTQRQGDYRNYREDTPVASRKYLSGMDIIDLAPACC